MANFAELSDVIALFRPLEPEELSRAEALLPVVCDSLRIEAEAVGVDLDKRVAASSAFANVAKAVTVDILSRTLLTATTGQPMKQESQSAMGYSWSGTFLNPGGGLFIKTSELARLGLKKQRRGRISL